MIVIFTANKGNNISRLNTCRLVNRQFSFFSAPICPGRMFICSITLFMITIVVPLFTISKFVLYSFAIIKFAHLQWVIQTSKPLLFQIYVNLCIWFFTCETWIIIIICCPIFKEGNRPIGKSSTNWLNFANGYYLFYILL